MPLLPGLAVVFVGLVGQDAGVERQVKTVVHELHLQPVQLAAAPLRTLTHHAAGTRDIVQKLHASGVVAFEVVTGHGEPTLRVVVYDADGGLKTYSEVSLGAHGLSADDLDVLRSNLQDDVVALGGGGDAEPAPAPAPAPAVKVAAPAIVAKAPPPAPIAKPPPPKPAPVAKAPETKPVDTAAGGDAVSADEIASLTEAPAETETPAAASSTLAALHLGAAVGFGVASRYFSPSPSTVAAFSATPVGALQLDAHVSPTANTQLTVLTDRTLQMTTPMRDGSIAATSISRWEALGDYALIRSGAVEVGPRVGAGRRSFSIAAMDPARTPDGEYDYLVLGMYGTAKLGKLTVRAAAAFEPVVSGTEPTEAAFGEATRWAFSLGGALEYRMFGHVFARAAAEYQRFTWSWDMAGARGAGGAVDEYPSGTLSLGADY